MILNPETSNSLVSHNISIHHIFDFQNSTTFIHDRDKRRISHSFSTSCDFWSSSEEKYYKKKGFKSFLMSWYTIREATKNSSVTLHTQFLNGNYFLVSKYLQLTLIYLLSEHLENKPITRNVYVEHGIDVFRIGCLCLIPLFVNLGVYVSPQSLSILFQSSAI